MRYIFTIFLSTSALFASQNSSGSSSMLAIAIFLLFVFATLWITFWAAKRTRTAKDFYTTGGGISTFQNGLAISGDYISAAGFLGISGLIYLEGFDGLIYLVGFLVGWPIVLFLFAEQLRNLGKYTFADVVSYRLKQIPIRALTAIASIATVLLYLVAQLVASGKLIGLLFGVEYEIGVILMGSLIVILVSYGGMLATTWVQIVKAVMLLSGVTFLAVAVMGSVDFSLERLFSSAIEIRGTQDIMSSCGIFCDPISAIGLGLALVLGTAGLPHVLMRFFTVSDAKEVRKSVFYAIGFMGYFYFLIFIVGFGAIILVAQNPEYMNIVQGGLVGGENMVAIHLAYAIGGDVLLGIIAAVAFATILAVVSGLTLAGASAISHDLYANVFAKKSVDSVTQMKVSRYATLGIGAVAILLGIAFENQNVAYLVALAFAIAASANFPILFLSIYWKRLTTRGAIIGGSLGLGTVVVLIVLGPVVWGEIIHGDASVAIFPYMYPALFSVTVAFVGIWFFSITDKSDSAKKEIEAYDDQYVISQIGSITK